MVGATNVIAPDNHNSFGGVEPVDMIASLEASFMELEQRTEITLRDLAQSLSFGVALEAQRLTPDADMFGYTLGKYRDVVPNEYISLEDISNSSKKVWDKSVLNLKKLQSETIEYARVINIGADRLLEKTEMLYGQAQNTKTKAYQPKFTIRSPAKFNIDGKYEPRDVTRVTAVAISAFTFYDKVFLKFMDAVSRVFDKLSFDHDFADDSGVNFAAFAPKTWMIKPVDVEKDERFRIDTPLYRTPPMQGNRALYASGPPETTEDEPKSWPLMVNTVRDFSFRYYTVPNLRTGTTGSYEIEVDEINGIRQRLSQLLVLAKKFQSRKGYESKLAGALRKIQITGEKVRTKAGQFKVEPEDEPASDPNVDKEKAIKGRPAISDVVQSITLMINNVARMVTDYNNCMAGILRTLGALTYIAEVELRQYQPPLRKPTTNTPGAPQTAAPQ